MSIKSFIATLAALALVVVPMTGASASNEPIPGIDVVVKKKPPKAQPLQVKTDAGGQFVLKDLEPGTYTLQIDGPVLTRVLASTATKSPTPTVQLLIGLLLPAVQKSRETSAPAPQAYRGQPGARGIEMTFTVPDSAGKTSTWKGTVEHLR